jgi:hypothetical protein
VFLSYRRYVNIGHDFRLRCDFFQMSLEEKEGLIQDGAIQRRGTASGSSPADHLQRAASVYQGGVGPDASVFVGGSGDDKQKYESLQYKANPMVRVARPCSGWCMFCLYALYC